MRMKRQGAATRRRNFRAVASFIFGTATLFGHDGERLEPHDLWRAWTFPPGIVIPLVFAGVLFARGAKTSRGVSATHFLCFWSGWALLTLSLISPLHPLGEVLFSAH